MFGRWFRRSPKSPGRFSARRHKSAFTRPAFELMEDRVVPATLDVVGGVLTFSNGAGEDNTVTLLLSGGNYTINDTASTITLGAGATGAGFVSNNANSVTGPAAGIASLSFDGGGDAADTMAVGSTLSLTGSVTLTGFSQVDLQSSITADGGQSYTAGQVSLSGGYTTTNNDFVVNGATTLAGVSVVSTGTGAIAFNGPVDGAFSLQASSSGTTTFVGDVGGIDPLAALIVDSGGTVTVRSVHTTSTQLYQDAATVNGSLTSSAGISFTSTVGLAGDSSLNADSVIFGAGSTIDGAFALSVTTTGPVALVFPAPVGGTTPLASFTANSASSLLVHDVTTAGDQSYTATNGIFLNGLYTTGGGNFLASSAVSLLGDTTIQAGAGGITFTSTVDGTFNLAANSSATTSFGGDVGATNPLASLSTDAGGTTLLRSVATINGQTYDDDTVILNGTYSTVGAGFTITNAAVVLGTTTIRTGAGAIALGSTVDKPTAGVVVLTLDSDADSTLATNFTGNLALTKDGSGTLTLSGVSTYAGTTTVSAGTLANGADNPLPATSPLVVAFGATYDLNGFNQTVGGLTGAGTVTNTAAAATLTVNNTTSDTFSGLLSGALSLVKGGVGSLTLTSANSFTGSTTVNGGTLANGVADALPTTTALTVNGGATYDLNGFDQQVAALTVGGSVLVGNNVLTVNGLTTLNGGSISSTGAGALQLGGDVTANSAATTATISGRLDLGAATRTFTIANGTPATDLDISAIIEGAAGVGLTKVGAGTLTLSGIATYDGDTTVSAGTLLIVGSAVVTGNVNVDNGGTLAGTGFIGGTLSSAAGGAVAPGENATPPNIGTLITQSLALAAGANFTPEIDATTGLSDRLAVSTAPVDITGAQLVPTVIGTPDGGASFLLIDNGSAGPVVGTFAGLPEGSLVAGTNLRISYVGGDGNDVTLTAEGALTYKAADGVVHDLVLSLVGTNLQLRDNGTLVRNVPLAGVTNVAITGAVDADDALTLNYAGGLFLLPISFDGGGNVGQTNSLVFSGGTFDSAAFGYGAPPPAAGAFSGTVTLGASGQTSVVSYSNLQPVLLNVGTVTDVVFDIPAAAGDVVFLEDNGVVNDGTSRLRSAGALFELTTFANPVGSLTVNVGAGNTFRVDTSFDSGPAGGQYKAPLTINAGVEDVFLEGTLALAGSLAVTAGNINVTAPISTSLGGTVTFTNSGTLTLGAVIAADGAVTQNGTGPVDLRSTILTTEDAVSFASAVSVTTAPAAIDTTNGAAVGTSTGANITFSGTLDGPEALQLRAGTAGDILFGGDVGLTTAPLGAVVIEGANDVTVTGALSATSWTETDGTGQASFGGAITTTVGNFAVTSDTIIVPSTAPITAAGAVTLTATTALQLGANITTAGGPVLLAGPIELTAPLDTPLLIDTTNAGALGADITFAAGSSLDGARPLTLTAGTGDVAFNGTVGTTTPLGAVVVASANNLTVAAAFNAASLAETAGTGTATLSGPVTTTAAPGVNITSANIAILAPVNVSGTGATATFVATAAITLGANITTSGNAVLFDGPTLLTASVVIDTTNGNATPTGANITFNSTLDSLPAGNDLTLRAGTTGDVTFNGIVGGTVAPGNVSIESANDVAINAAFQAGSLTISGITGTVSLNAPVTVSNPGGVSITAPSLLLGNNIITAGAPVVFDAPVILTADVAIDTTNAGAVPAGANITFQQTVNGTQALTLTAGTAGDILFNDAVGNTAALGAVGIVSANDVTITTTFNAASLAQTAGTGTTTLDGAVTTTAAPGVNLTANQVVVNAPISVSGAGATVALTGTSGGAGAVQLGSNITTAGNPVSITGAAVLTASITIDTTNGVPTGAAISFGGTLDGAFNLTLTAGTAGNVDFVGNVGSATPLGAVTVTQANDVTIQANFQADSLTVTDGRGETELRGAVTTFTAPGVDITANTIVVGNAASITASGALPPPANGVRLNATSAGAAAVQLGGDITTAGLPVDIIGAVLLTDDVTIDTTPGAPIHFAGTIDGTQDLTLNAGSDNDITLDGNVGVGTRLDVLTFTNAQDVTTQRIVASQIRQLAGSGTTTFGGDLDANGAGIDLTGENFTSTHNIAVNGTFRINPAGLANFSGIISGTAALVKDGAGTLRLTGANTYTGGSTVNAGTVEVGHDTALGTGSVTLGNGTTLTPINGARTLANPIVFGTAAGDVAILAGSVDLTLTGALSGPGGVTITNTAKVTYAAGAAGTYTGPTTLQGGILEVNRTIVSEVRLDNRDTAVLQGTGTVGAITAVDGGTVKPGGDAIGILTVSGDVTFNTRTTLVEQFRGRGNGVAALPPPVAGTHHDQLVVGGALDLGGAALTLSAELAPASSHASMVDDLFVLIDKTSAGAIVNTFGSINGVSPAPAITLFDSQRFELKTTGPRFVSDATLNSNDVTLTHVNTQPTQAPITLTRVDATRLKDPDGIPLAVAGSDRIVEMETVRVDGSFIDADRLDTITVTISWGDGSPNTVLTFSPTARGFAGAGEPTTFSASHKYLTAQVSPITVTVNDGHGTPATVGDHQSAAATPQGKSLTVLDAPLQFLTARQLNGIGNSLQIGGPLLTFKDASNQNAVGAGEIRPVSTFQALVDWGDGTSEVLPAGSVSFDPATQVYTVVGTHIYAAAGIYRIAVAVVSDGSLPVARLAPDHTVGKVCSLAVVGSSNDVFFDQLFRGTFGRPADQQYRGIIDRVVETILSASAPLLNLIQNETVREQRRAVLFEQIENRVLTQSVLQQVLVSPESYEQTVKELYCTFFNRPPDESGLAFWTRYLAQGGNRQSLAAILMGTDEYFSHRAGSTNNVLLVQSMYQDYLGRAVPPTPDEISFWTGLLNAGVNRAVVANAICFSKEGDDVQIRRIFGRYVGLNLMLGNAADQAIVDRWQARLRQTSLFTVTREILLQSSEFNALISGQSPAGLLVNLRQTPLFPASDSKAFNQIIEVINGRGVLGTLVPCEQAAEAFNPFPDDLC